MSFKDGLIYAVLIYVIFSLYLLLEKKIHIMEKMPRAILGALSALIAFVILRVFKGYL